MTRSWILLLLCREASAFCFLEAETPNTLPITEQDVKFSTSYDVTAWLDQEDMDLYYTPRGQPGSTRTRPMYMHIHGGAWKHTGQGNADRNGDMVPWLVQKYGQYGMVTSNIEYRLWHGVVENLSDLHYHHLRDPHGFIIEVGVEDARSAIRYMVQRTDLGIDMRMLVVGGDSAGGINALMLGYNDESQFEGLSGCRDADFNPVINTLAPPNGPGHSLPPFTNIAVIVAISATIGYWGFTAKDVRQAGKNDRDWTAPSLVQVVGDSDVIWDLVKTNRVNNNVARNPEAHYVGQTVIHDGNHIPIHPWVYDAYRRTTMSVEDWDASVSAGTNVPWTTYKATCWWCLDNTGDLVDGINPQSGLREPYMVDFMEHVACAVSIAPSGCAHPHDAFDCAPGLFINRMAEISLGRNAVNCDCQHQQAHINNQYGGASRSRGGQNARDDQGNAQKGGGGFAADDR